MKRRYQLSLLVLCLGLFLAANAFGQAAWTWGIKPIGLAGTGFYENSVNGVSIDDSGNTFVSGTFNDSATISGTKIKAQTHGLDAFIAKFNSAGTFQWVRTIGSPYDQDQGMDVATDPSGNVYTVSYFQDSATLGTTVIYQGLSASVLLAKYNGAGTLQWARLVTGLSVANFGAVAYSPDGSLYVGNSLTLGKYASNNGDSLWTISPALDSGQLLINDIAVDYTGDYIYYTGVLIGKVHVGSVTLNSGDQSDWAIFLLKVDKNGNAIWGKQAGDTVNNLYDIGHGVEVDHAGNVYTCGQFSGTAHFDTVTVSAGNAFWGMFVAKYNSAGNIQWVKGGTGPSNAYFSTATDVKLVSNETAVLVSASFNASVNFGGSTFSITAGGDALVLKVNSSGVLQWGKQSGSIFALITANALDVNRTTSNFTLVGKHASFAATFTPLPAFPAPTGGVADGFIVGGTTDSPTPVKEKPSNVLPENFSLAQNYPNPFNPTTNIDYQVPTRSHVTITVYNVLGEQVQTLVDEEQHAGTYTVTWNGRNATGQQAATGVYMYRIQAGDYSESKKMVLIK